MQALGWVQCEDGDAHSPALLWAGAQGARTASLEWPRGHHSVLPSGGTGGAGQATVTVTAGGQAGHLSAGSMSTLCVHH